MSEQIRRSEPGAELLVTFGLVGAVAGGEVGRYAYHLNAAPLVHAEHVIANEHQQIVGIQNFEHQVDAHVNAETKASKGQIAARRLLDHNAHQDIAKLHTEIGAQQYALPIVSTGRGIEGLFISGGAMVAAGLLAFVGCGLRSGLSMYRQLLSSSQLEAAELPEPDQQLVTADEAQALQDLYNFE